MAYRPDPIVVPRLTKEQAAIIGAYTGIACGPFRDIQEYGESKLGRPISPHEAANAYLWTQLKIVCMDDFRSLCYEKDAK